VQEDGGRKLGHFPTRRESGTTTSIDAALARELIEDGRGKIQRFPSPEGMVCPVVPAVMLARLL